jgi:hypothetical protein
MEWLVPVVRPISAEATHVSAGGLGGGWQRLLLLQAGKLRMSGVLPGWDAFSLALVPRERGRPCSRPLSVHCRAEVYRPSSESWTGAVADRAWDLRWK